VRKLRNFFIGSILTIIILIALLGYRQNIFSQGKLPFDDEQVGLENQIIIKFSHVVAENTPKGLAAEKFAQLVEAKSNGRIIVQIYPNGMLYNDDNELIALKEGDIQMIAPTTSKMTEYLPNWQILDLPFLIDDERELKTVLTGPISEKLIGELETLNIKGLTFWNNGFKQIASSHSPILETQDFWHKKIRMMPSDILKEQFYLLRAKPIATTFGNVYNELESMTVDAQENTISNMFSKKFYEMENHITLSNHGILSYVVMMNENFWNHLSPEDQQIINDSLEEMESWQFELANNINAINLQTLRQNKEVFIYELDKVNREKWNEVINPIYDYYSKNVQPDYLNELLQELNK